MATRTRNRLLAQGTRIVEQQTRRRSALTLMGMIEQHLAQRAAHSAAIATIDGELARVFERLAQDRPTATPPAPTGAPPDVRPTAGEPRQTPPLVGLGVKSAAARDLIVAALEKAGPVPSAAIYDACAGFNRASVKHALRHLIRDGRVIRSGRTLRTRYQLAPVAKPVSAKPQASAPTNATRSMVNADGVEYEVAWRPGRDAPSLLGDRQQRAGGL